MRLSIRRFESRDVPALDRLNARLRAGGAGYEVYGEGGEDDPSRPVRERLYVAAQGAEIRGAVWLREHEFWAGGRPVTAGWAKYPVSESLVAPGYNGVPAALVVKLLREQPRLMALGMGGLGGPFARLLAGMRWHGEAIPFQFRIVRPHRVLRGLAHLRRTPLRRLLLDALAMTGAGWLAHRAGHGVARLRGRRPPRGYGATDVAAFGDWADTLWRACRDRYGFLAVRHAAMLNFLYPPSFEGLARLRVTRGGETVGWICVHRADLARGDGDPRFGRLVVGLLADGVAAPEHAAGVLGTGFEYLAASGADLVFSNQSHPAWRQALERLRFLRGPSTFAFYRSPAVQDLMGEPTVAARGVYVNRGDCDGPRWW